MMPQGDLTDYYEKRGFTVLPPGKPLMLCIPEGIEAVAYPADAHMQQMWRPLAPGVTAPGGVIDGVLQSGRRAGTDLSHPCLSMSRFDRFARHLRELSRQGDEGRYKWLRLLALADVAQVSRRPSCGSKQMSPEDRATSTAYEAAS
ncbi:hypothetical protein F4556_006713 [Kitasatospora gansuensis]|uniref:Uncharacterized protein n=1 Tax=Kitasatospora gansuensis TaxID=258050 RepID=A0A7W7WLE1_9ACTN|nr:hypothetical protein [Kitasatospora gansuensis]